jgi:hypothetical protein
VKGGVEAAGTNDPGKYVIDATYFGEDVPALRHLVLGAALTAASGAAITTENTVSRLEQWLDGADRLVGMEVGRVLDFCQAARSPLQHWTAGLTYCLAQAARGAAEQRPSEDAAPLASLVEGEHLEIRIPTAGDGRADRLYAIYPSGDYGVTILVSDLRRDPWARSVVWRGLPASAREALDGRLAALEATAVEGCALDVKRFAGPALILHQTSVDPSCRMQPILEGR